MSEASGLAESPTSQNSSLPKTQTPPAPPPELDSGQPPPPSAPPPASQTLPTNTSSPPRDVSGSSPPINSPSTPPSEPASSPPPPGPSSLTPPASPPNQLTPPPAPHPSPPPPPLSPPSSPPPYPSPPPPPASTSPPPPKAPSHHSPPPPTSPPPPSPPPPKVAPPLLPPPSSNVPTSPPPPAPSSPLSPPLVSGAPPPPLSPPLPAPIFVPPPTISSSGAPPAPGSQEPPVPSPPGLVNPPPNPPSVSPHSPPTVSTIPPLSVAPSHGGPSSEPSDNLIPSASDNSPNSNENQKTVTVVGITVAGTLIILAALVFFFCSKKKKLNGITGRHRRPPGELIIPKANYASNPAHSPPVEGSYGCQVQTPDGSKSWFTYDELVSITNGFSPENHIGEGGFGSVYKGLLPDGKLVAVKQLKLGSGQGEREFKAEVEIINRVHHRHLVSLVSYCIADHHRLLVYEYVSNKTLAHHLHGKGVPVLDWSKRIKIAIGSARGIAYLHEDCHPRIIHRDIKSANILLDDSFEAKVADFGLARLANDTNTHVSTRVMGTFGYLAPEYASSGKLTDRSDVYSFGVVLVELITGRKPVDTSRPIGDESLVEWARPILVHALNTGEFDELVDPKLEKEFVESEMLIMIEAAAACVRHSAPKRPRMVQVMRALDSDRNLPDLSNGVKFGQSTIYNSGQYSAEILQLRRMAFDADSNFSIDYDHTSECDRGSSMLSSQENKRSE